MHVWHSPGGRKPGGTICCNIKCRKTRVGPHFLSKVIFKLTSERQLSPPVRAPPPPPAGLCAPSSASVDVHVTLSTLDGAEATSPGVPRRRLPWPRSGHLGPSWWPLPLDWRGCTRNNPWLARLRHTPPAFPSAPPSIVKLIVPWHLSVSGHVAGTRWGTWGSWVCVLFPGA